MSATPLRTRKIDGNELWWLHVGPGAHGEEPLAPREVVEALAGRFIFREGSDTEKGLRRPQLGALHAMLAHESMEIREPVTIVMPTGTGKTETMLAAFAHSPKRVLVVVPSDALRTQIATKLGLLHVWLTSHVWSRAPRKDVRRAEEVPA
jgi:hypothetical protein